MYSTIIARLLSALMSLVDASNLRNRLYEARDRVDTLELALEDIARINASEATVEERERLIADICGRLIGGKG